MVVVSRVWWTVYNAKMAIHVTSAHHYMNLTPQTNNAQLFAHHTANNATSNPFQPYNQSARNAYLHTTSTLHLHLQNVFQFVVMGF